MTTEKRRILNIEIRNISFKDFLEELERGLVVTPNVDHLIKLQHDRALYECYRQAEHVVCDSRIVQFASKLLYPDAGIVEPIVGSDLLPAYCIHHGAAGSAVRVFLLGGSPESVLTARDNLNQKAGRAVVIDAYSPPFGFEHDALETDHIISRINASGATALAVGVGAPKQELWIQRHRGRMPGVDVFFAVGAAIDFAAGTVPRAPRWMRRAGLEWLYRLLQEPGRLFRRYLVDDPPFFWLILKQRLGRYRDPWR